MQDPKGGSQETRDESGAYEAPCVETVVTPDEVEREAHYGGFASMT